MPGPAVAPSGAVDQMWLRVCLGSCLCGLNKAVYSELLLTCAAHQHASAPSGPEAAGPNKKRVVGLLLSPLPG